MACVAIEFQLCGPLVPSWIGMDSFMISTSTAPTSSAALFNGFFQFQLGFSELAESLDPTDILRCHGLIIQQTSYNTPLSHKETTSSHE